LDGELGGYTQECEIVDVDSEDNVKEEKRSEQQSIQQNRLVGSEKNHQSREEVREEVEGKKKA
jgi:hypothetical protein